MDSVENRHEEALAKINAVLRNYEEYGTMRRNLQHSSDIWSMGHTLGSLWLKAWDGYNVDGVPSYIAPVKSHKTCRERVKEVLGWEADYAFGRETEKRFKSWCESL